MVMSGGPTLVSTVLCSVHAYLGDVFQFQAVLCTLRVLQGDPDGALV